MYICTLDKPQCILYERSCHSYIDKDKKRNEIQGQGSIEYHLKNELFALILETFVLLNML
jgi:hypothetical protein